MWRTLFVPRIKKQKSEVDNCLSYGEMITDRFLFTYDAFFVCAIG